MITETAQKLISIAQGGAYSANAREVKKHVLFDTRYFNATISDWPFFTVPAGGNWVGGTNKTENETNMQESGRLPTGQTMVFTHFAPHFCIHYPDKETPDLAEIIKACLLVLENSVFELTIRNKAPELFIHGSELLPRPIFLSGLQGNTEDAEDFASVGHGVSLGWHNLDPVPVPLGDGQGFSMSQSIENPVAAIDTLLDAASATLSTNNVTMQVLLAGVTTHSK